MQRYQNPEGKIADINLAKLGKKLVQLAYSEMPGLIALQRQFKKSQPLKGANILGCLHMTVQTAVLIETLVALGAKVRWCGCNVFSTNDAAAAYVYSLGIPVFAWKNQTEKEYLQCIDDVISLDPNFKPNMVIDDGADLIFRLHEKFPHIAKKIIGASEETTTGVKRIRELAASKKLLFPVMNVNDAVTKSKFDNLYGCRESLIDGIKRATNLMIAGKTALVCGYGDVGKGAAAALKSFGARVIISEIDPICALQAAMEGYDVKKVDSVIQEVDIVVTATGNKHVIKHEHLLRLKNFAVVCNIGHFDLEIDLSKIDFSKKVNIKPQVDLLTLSNNKKILLLAEGRLVNLGCADGHPSFVMSMSFCNQVLAQISLFNNKYSNELHLIPKLLDEHVAKIHLESLGYEVENLNESQSDYINTHKQGPFKDNQYRY